MIKFQEKKLNERSNKSTMLLKHFVILIFLGDFGIYSERANSKVLTFNGGSARSDRQNDSNLWQEFSAPYEHQQKKLIKEIKSKAISS